jgi:hypothetical protein
MSEQEDFRNFVISFFTNLKADISYHNDGKKLIVNNISPEFELFYGKKAPYEIVFRKSDALNGEEVMVKGSFLLNCMQEFLENKAQTTLVKINFDISHEKELQKYILLRNCKITNITKKDNYDWLVRFTFLTTMQYLNEKEQIMTPVYVKNNDIIKFDLDKYPLIDGKKEDIQIKTLKEKYLLAKDYLKVLIEPKILKLSETLNLKLDKEIQRVRQHYLNQIGEDKQNIQKSEKQLAELESQIKDTTNKGVDREFIKIRVKKLKEIIAHMHSPGRIEELKKEEEFFINDENHRHSLNINNKIMNTTVAYFPIFSYSCILKNSNATRVFNLNFNPLSNEISEIKCDCCDKAIKDISLCSNGHISCQNCFRGCSECGEDYCSKCLKNSCFSCSKRLCKKCSKRCITCGKIKCGSHMGNSSRCLSCGEKKIRI